MPRKSRRRLTAWLESAPKPVFTAYAMAAAFCTYFCMYAFRKPFAAAEFSDLQFFGTHFPLKTAMVIGQMVGYTLSKYAGIKFIAEMPRRRRAAALVLSILGAEAALVLFGTVPGEWKVLAMFLNGIPLGTIWGLVVWHLEGRRTSEILLAGLSCSYIVASGAVKDVGRALIDELGVSEAWMPSAVGACFLPISFISIWLLSQVPKPDEADVAARIEREPMDGSQRASFVLRYLFGLVLVFLVYFYITAYRDFRDNYGREIFRALGYGDTPMIFSRSEIPVAFGVMFALAMLNLIKDNRRGLVGAYAIMTFGTLLLGGGTLLFDAGLISGLAWMILTGLGGFLTYVPFGSVLFDRMIASTRTIGTAVFAIYVADAIGYTGSIGLMLYKDLLWTEVTRLEFFRGLTYFMSLFGTACLVLSCLYFWRKTRPREP